jgi:hypothetical protein
LLLLGGAVLAGFACSTSGNVASDGGLDVAARDAARDANKLPPPDATAPGAGASVLEHHLHGSRDGAYLDARVTKAAAASVVIDSGFNGKVTGILYGQPLYVDGWQKGKDAVLVATDQNHVTALDATSGAVLWDKVLGPPVNQGMSLPCGGPYPWYGVTGTPVIDFTTRTLYAESFQTPDGGTTKKHYLYALSIDDGSVRSGWPVDVAAKVAGFDATVQHARGGLTIVGGTVYAPYSGLNGDCGSYHGWVVGVSTSDPSKVGAYATAASKGGIWASVTTDGVAVYAVTGNTTGASTWGGGEAVLRLTQMARFSGAPADYFTPSNWQSLDGSDSDLGSSAAVFFDVPGATPETLAVAMGKGGVVHLLNRGNLGGVGTGDGQNGEGLFSLGVGSEMKGVSAAYATATAHYVVLRADNNVSVCPGGTSGDLLALRVTPTAPPKLVPAWCANSQGAGSPIATTTDGTSNALVWIVSAEGSERLLAFDGDTGAAVYTGGGAAEQLGTVHHWTSPIVAKGRFFVGGEGKVYAFKTQ